MTEHGSIASPDPDTQGIEGGSGGPTPQVSHSTAGPGFWTAVLAAWLLLVALAVVLRVVLFYYGTLVGPVAERAANAVIAGLLLVAAMVTVHAAYRRRNTQPEVGSYVGWATTALGLIAAALGGVQLIFPATPYAAAAPACRGASVAGADFLGQTLAGNAGGVNARAGAGTAFEQTNRYGDGCTLAFEGYCVGEPVDDPRSDLADTRWLIVRNRAELVTSARISDQSPASKLGSEPDERCDDLFGGFQQPGRPVVDVEQRANEVLVSVEEPDARLIGYASFVGAKTSTSAGYEPLDLQGGTNEFNTSISVSSLSEELDDRSGSAYVAVSSCLAADAATATPSIVRVVIDGGLVTTTEAVPEDVDRDQLPFDFDLLARTACAGPD